jgi:hypothetical protein
LFVETAVAGEFNTTKKVWTIRFPFWLLVNANALPTVERPLPAYRSGKDIVQTPDAPGTGY